VRTDNTSHCSPDRDRQFRFIWRHSMKTLRRIVVGFLVLTFLASVIACTGVASKRKSLNEGQTAVIYNGNPKGVWVTSSQEAYYEVLEKKKLNDHLGITGMSLSGRYFIVSDHTKALVLYAGVDASEVRILEGEHVGRTAWVDTDWVHSNLDEEAKEPIRDQKKKAEEEAKKKAEAEAERKKAEAERKKVEAECQKE
jgi:hypothetical protein